MFEICLEFVYCYVVYVVYLLVLVGGVFEYLVI